MQDKYRARLTINNGTVQTEWSRAVMFWSSRLLRVGLG